MPYTEVAIVLTVGLIVSKAKLSTSEYLIVWMSAPIARRDHGARVRGTQANRSLAGWQMTMCCRTNAPLKRISRYLSTQGRSGIIQIRNQPEGGLWSLVGLPACRTLKTRQHPHGLTSGQCNDHRLWSGSSDVEGKCIQWEPQRAWQLHIIIKGPRCACIRAAHCRWPHACS